MSWALLLSQYNKPVLENNSAPLILAWLERVGLSTEDEISKDLGIEKYKLLKIMLDLYQDRFIEYDENHVKISERGKKVIDRFGITDEIIKDIIFTFKSSKKDEFIFLPLCKRYREESFSDYLRTIWLMRTWERLASLGRKKSKKELKNINIGKMSILLLDLRKRYVTSPQIFDKQDASNFFHLKPDNNSFKSEYYESPEVKNALNWVGLYDDLISKKISTEDTLAENNSKSFFLIYSLINEKVPHISHSFWDNELTNSLNSKKQINLREFYDKVLTNIELENIEDLRDIKTLDIYKSYSHLNHPTESSEILDYLLLSESLDDFVSKTGLTKESAIIVLEKIKYKTINLLKKE